MTPKQQMFVKEYLVDLNATQACIRAGYSKRTADRIGPELLGKPCVKAAISKAMDERSKRTEITADRVLQELAKIGFGDIRKMFTDTGSLRAISELDDEAAASLSSIEIVTRRVPGGDEAEVEHVAKIKLWDKRAALVDLGKHLKLFTDKVQHEGDMIVRLSADDEDL